MKQTGMLVISLRSVSFGFWSPLGCSGQSAKILSRQEIQNYAKRNRSQIFFLTCFVLVYLSVLKRSSLGLTKSLSHAQMVSFGG